MFNDAMGNLGRHRQELSEKADKLVIITENDMTNVSLELSLFTDGKVICWDNESYVDNAYKILAMLK